MSDEPFDLDALIAERDTPPLRFRFAGQDFTLPGSVDVRAAARLSAGDPLGALELLLGAEQFARFDSADAVFDDTAYKALLERYRAHLGIGRGE